MRDSLRIVKGTDKNEEIWYYFYDYRNYIYGVYGICYHCDLSDL